MDNLTSIHLASSSQRSKLSESLNELSEGPKARDVLISEEHLVYTDADLIGHFQNNASESQFETRNAEVSSKIVNEPRQSQTKSSLTDLA